MWSVYWCIYSILIIMDPILNLVFFFVPFYYPLKMMLLTWLFAPRVKVIYLYKIIDVRLYIEL